MCYFYEKYAPLESLNKCDNGKDPSVTGARHYSPYPVRIEDWGRERRSQKLWKEKIGYIWCIKEEKEAFSISFLRQNEFANEGFFGFLVSDLQEGKLDLDSMPSGYGASISSRYFVIVIGMHHMSIDADQKPVKNLQARDRGLNIGSTAEVPQPEGI